MSLGQETTGTRPRQRGRRHQLCAVLSGAHGSWTNSDDVDVPPDHAASCLYYAPSTDPFEWLPVPDETLVDAVPAGCLAEVAVYELDDRVICDVRFEVAHAADSREVGLAAYLRFQQHVSLSVAYGARSSPRVLLMRMVTIGPYEVTRDTSGSSESTVLDTMDCFDDHVSSPNDSLNGSHGSATNTDDLMLPVWVWFERRATAYVRLGDLLDVLDDEERRFMFTVSFQEFRCAADRHRSVLDAFVRCRRASGSLGKHLCSFSTFLTMARLPRPNGTGTGTDDMSQHGGARGYHERERARINRNMRQGYANNGRVSPPVGGYRPRPPGQPGVPRNHMAHAFRPNPPHREPERAPLEEPLQWHEVRVYHKDLSLQTLFDVAAGRRRFLLPFCATQCDAYALGYRSYTVHQFPLQLVVEALREMDGAKMTDGFFLTLRYTMHRLPSFSRLDRFEQAAVFNWFPVYVYQCFQFRYYRDSQIAEVRPQIPDLCLNVRGRALLALDSFACAMKSTVFYPTTFLMGYSEVAIWQHGKPSGWVTSLCSGAAGPLREAGAVIERSLGRPSCILAKSMLATMLILGPLLFGSSMTKSACRLCARVSARLSHSLSLAAGRIALAVTRFIWALSRNTSSSGARRLLRLLTQSAH